MMHKDLLIRNFSRHARRYDRHCRVQKVCAEALIKIAPRRRFYSILDIGCGTGNYTGLLADLYPYARIKAVDISPGMVEVARAKLRHRRIEFIVSDAEEIDLSERFDLISSNACFQWFEDIKSALKRYRAMLNAGGALSFSMFGPLTFIELKESVREVLGGDVSIISSKFEEKSRIEAALRGIFKEAIVRSCIYKESYPSLKHLLDDIRYTGTRGNGASKKLFWTKRKMRDIENIYRKRHKDITATYQALFCMAKK